MNHSLTKFLPSFVRAKLEGRTNLKNILANTGWLFADRIFRMGVGLFVGVWVARYLGPEQFGVYNYALSFVALFGTFATLGLDGIVVRDIVRDPSRKNEILGTAFVLKLLGGVLTLLLTMGAISLLRPHDILVSWLVGITVCGTIFQAFDVIDFWFQSQVHSKYTVYAKSAAFLLIALIKVILVLIKAPLIAFAFAGMSEVVLGAIGIVFTYVLNGQTFKVWQMSLLCAKKLFRDSWPMIITNAMIVIYMRIDQIMLGSMVGNKAVGLYSVAIRISEIWYFIPVVIMSSVFPTIVKTKQQNRELYFEKMQYLYKVLIWVAIGIAIPLTFISNEIISKMFGEKYAGAGSVLSIHIWAAVFVFYSVGKHIFVQCENMQLFSLVCTASGAFINVGLNILLIKKYEIVGAAVATLCAQITSSIIIPSLYHKDRISVKLFFKSFLCLPNPK